MCRYGRLFAGDAVGVNESGLVLIHEADDREPVRAGGTGERRLGGRVTIRLFPFGCLLW